MGLTVVSVKAFSYSGTTWCNLVLGSHDRAFTLGPPWRVWELKDKGFVDADLVHGRDSVFWNGFNAFWDRKENFLLALGRYAGVSHVIFDNPSAEFRETVMNHPDVTVKELSYLRDGRSISASYARKNPQYAYLETITPSGWLYYSFVNKLNSTSDPAAPIFHYEHVHADPVGFLARAGDYIGLDYDERSLRFWEWDHHITWGNPGTVATLRLAKGLPVGNFTAVEFYRTQFEQLKADPSHVFEDTRWVDELSREDLFYFDFLMGKANAEYGYARDIFSPFEIETFGRKLLTHAEAGMFSGLGREEVAGYLKDLMGSTE